MILNHSAVKPGMQKHVSCSFSFTVKVRADSGILQCGQCWTVDGEAGVRGRTPTPFTDDLL